jgi:hypothetical protein
MLSIIAKLISIKRSGDDPFARIRPLLNSFINSKIGFSVSLPSLGSPFGEGEQA